MKADVWPSHCTLFISPLSWLLVQMLFINQRHFLSPLSFAWEEVPLVDVLLLIPSICFAKVSSFAFICAAWSWEVVPPSRRVVKSSLLGLLVRAARRSARIDSSLSRFVWEILWRDKPNRANIMDCERRTHYLKGWGHFPWRACRPSL